jgi:phosphoribosylanthranilate isomerase
MDFDAHAILLDSFSPEEYGGSGKQVDWKLARDLWVMVPCLYLAGGLAADNVANAIREVWPFGVDACSRLESSPGKKDRQKVAAFIKAAKEAL